MPGFTRSVVMQDASREPQVPAASYGRSRRETHENYIFQVAKIIIILFITALDSSVLHILSVNDDVALLTSSMVKTLA